MSGLEVIASVVGVAAFGTKLTASLYEVGEHMIRARSQIRSIARNVSLLTDAIRHVRDVLESRQAVYSTKLVRSIKRVMRSCERTFRKINETINSKKSYSSVWGLVRIRWLFKKPQAEEMEAKMDSLKVTLQVLVQTITLGELGKGFDKIEQRSEKQMENIKSYIAQLKNTITANQDLAARLHRAESAAALHASRKDTPAEVPSANFAASEQAPQIVTSSSNSASSEEEEVEKPLPTKHRPTGIRMDTSQAWKPSDSDQRVAIDAYKPKPIDKVSATSKILLQVVPWTGSPEKAIHSEHNSSVGFLLQHTAHQQARTTTDAIRLLLNDYTLSGAGPIEDLLEEDEANSLREGRSNTKGGDSMAYERDINEVGEELSEDSTFSSDTETQVESRDIATSAALEALSLAQAGRQIWQAVVKSGGNVFWMKGNEREITCYMGPKQFYRFAISHAHPQYDYYRYRWTRISKQWVRKEVLELHQFRFIEKADGTYHVFGDLRFSKVKELTILSLGGFEKTLYQQAQGNTFDLADTSSGLSNPFTTQYARPYGYPSGYNPWDSDMMRDYTAKPYPDVNSYTNPFADGHPPPPTQSHTPMFGQAAFPPQTSSENQQRPDSPPPRWKWVPSSAAPSDRPSSNTGWKWVPNPPDPVSTELEQTQSNSAKHRHRRSPNRPIAHRTKRRQSKNEKPEPPLPTESQGRHNLLSEESDEASIDDDEEFESDGGPSDSNAPSITSSRGSRSPADKVRNRSPTARQSSNQPDSSQNTHGTGRPNAHPASDPVPYDEVHSGSHLAKDARASNADQHSASHAHVSFAAADVELKKLREKRASLLQRLGKAQGAGDADRAADIEFYALPDVDARIERLEAGGDDTSDHLRPRAGGGGGI